MASAHERAGPASYAVTRWPAVVRTLVLLGPPPREAHRLAGRAVARLLEAPGSDDHEAALFAEVVRVWEDGSGDWWRTELPEVAA